MTENSKPRIKKPKIFAVTVTDGYGAPISTTYVEHYSKPQAQAAVLDGRVTVTEADHNDLLRIGRERITILRHDSALGDDAQGDAFGQGQQDE